MRVQGFQCYFKGTWSGVWIFQNKCELGHFDIYRQSTSGIPDLKIKFLDAEFFGASAKVIAVMSAILVIILPIKGCDASWHSSVVPVAYCNAN